MQNDESGRMTKRAAQATKYRRAMDAAVKRIAVGGRSRLLTRDETCEFFGGIHYATLYRGVAEGRYPAPIHIGPNTSRWVEAECEAVVLALIAERNGQTVPDHRLMHPQPQKEIEHALFCPAHPIETTSSRAECEMVRRRLIAERDGAMEPLESGDAAASATNPRR